MEVLNLAGPASLQSLASRAAAAEALVGLGAYSQNEPREGASSSIVPPLSAGLLAHLPKFRRVRRRNSK